MERHALITSPAKEVARRQQSGFVPQIQYLRGVAALVVLIYHASLYVAQFRGATVFLDALPAATSQYGVILFFVLSGHLMESVSSREDWHVFVLRRAARIYPLLLLVSAACVVLFLAFGFGRRPDLWSWTLLPLGRRDYMLGVEWTLIYEMAYYVSLALCLALGGRKLAQAVAGVAVVVLVAAIVMAPGRTQSITPYLTQIPALTLNLAFAAGFLIVPALRFRRAYLLGLGLATLVLASGAGDFSTLVLIGSALLVVAGSAGGDWKLPTPIHNVLKDLGDASYALYLVHVPLILVLTKALTQAASASAVWLLALGMPIAAALLLLPVDRGLHRAGARLVAALSPLQSRMIATAAILAYLSIAAAFDPALRPDR